MKKDSNLTLDELVEQITSSVDDSWDTLKQIRYVYLELGSYLEKNTDFFMSVEKKVTKRFQLSKEEINDIYSDELSDGSRKNWNRVICKSAAIILAKCLNKLGIENKIITTTNATYFGEDEDAVEIRHVFVNAKLNENESIFLTLAADLPYIQNGMSTQCFGNLISYRKQDENGNEVIMYEGPEITDAKEIDIDTLKQIDCDLGYLDLFCDDGKEQYVYTDYYFDLLRKKLSKNKLYLDLLAQGTDFYDIVYSGETFELNRQGLYKIQKVMMSICYYIDLHLNFDYELKLPFNYIDWYNSIMVHAENLDNNNGYYAINCSCVELIKYVNNLIDVYADYGTIILNDEETDEVKREKIIACNNRIKRITYFISQQFVDLYVLPKKDVGFVTQEYIANKLNVLFTEIFGCNTEIREFNELNYNEQIAIIRLVIPMIFSDIKDKDCMFDRRSKCLPCIYNIIRTYTLKMVKDNSYRIIFEIDNTGYPVYYSYDLSSNKFKCITQTKFYFLAVNNIICSRDLKDKLNIEEIEEDVQLKK